VTDSHQLVTVETDKTQVRSLIDSTARILVEHGATIDPSVAIRESGGHLSVHSAASPPDTPLFVIPQELLVPVAEITWAIMTNKDTGMRSMTVESAQNLTPVQRDLLDLHIDLYNSLNKFEWFLNEHPRAALSDFPDVERLFTECEPNFTRGQEPEDFLASRVLGYRAKGPAADHLPKKSVLMPLVDLMNHHPRGAAFDTSNGALSVLASQPASDSECFVNYGGLRDALQMFSSYGFADESTTVATSICATLPLIGESPATLGTLKVERKHSKGHLPRVTVKESTLTLSKVTFAPRKLDRFNAAFSLPVKSFAMQQGASPELADQVAEQAARELIEINQQQLGVLLETVIALNSERVVLRELESALRVQLRSLDNFVQRLAML